MVRKAPEDWRSRKAGGSWQDLLLERHHEAVDHRLFASSGKTAALTPGSVRLATHHLFELIAGLARELYMRTSSELFIVFAQGFMQETDLPAVTTAPPAEQQVQIHAQALPARQPAVQSERLQACHLSAGR